MHLDDLLAGATPETAHKETSLGPAVGKGFPNEADDWLGNVCPWNGEGEECEACQ